MSSMCCRLITLLPGLPLLAMAFIPISEMPIWQRAIIVTLLMSAFYALNSLSRKALRKKP